MGAHAPKACTLRVMKKSAFGEDGRAVSRYRTPAATAPTNKCSPDDRKLHPHYVMIILVIITRL